MFSNELSMFILLYIKFITNRHKVFHGWHHRTTIMGYIQYCSQ